MYGGYKLVAANCKCLHIYTSISVNKKYTVSIYNYIEVVNYIEVATWPGLTEWMYHIQLHVIQCNTVIMYMY